jgi:hypothetical protein
MATKPLSDLTATWNNVATTFTAIKMNATDTASASGSMLMDLQVGGASQFKVTKAGAATITTIELGNASDTTLSRVSAGVVAIEGVAVPTISSTDTLTNKTLSSPTLSGTVTASGSIVLASANPQLDFNDTNSTSTERYWRWATFGATLGLDLCNDAGAGQNNFLEFTRSGVVPSLANIKCAIQSNGVAVPTISSTDTLTNKTLSGVTIADATNIILNTTTGTKIGTATSQKIGFFDKTPVVQPTAVADATTAVDVITRFNELLTRMRNLGLIAT